MPMFILKPIKNWFNNYDHYGVMAVSSMQAVFISISALIINFLFMSEELVKKSEDVLSNIYSYDIIVYLF